MRGGWGGVQNTVLEETRELWIFSSLRSAWAKKYSIMPPLYDSRMPAKVDFTKAMNMKVLNNNYIIDNDIDLNTTYTT